MSTKIIKSNINKICKKNSVRSEGSWVCVSVTPTIEEVVANPFLADYFGTKNHISNIPDITFGTYMSDDYSNSNNYDKITVDINRPEMIQDLTDKDWLDKNEAKFKNEENLLSDLYCDLYNLSHDRAVAAKFICQNISQLLEIYKA